MIKIGIRKNLLYPSLFIAFIATRKIIKFILEKFITKNNKCSFLMISLMVLIEFILGLYYSLKRQKDININNNKTDKKQTNKEDSNENELIIRANSLKRRDKDCKIILLMVFSAYFEIIGCSSRKLITLFDQNSNDYDEFNARFRGAETCISSLLCHFTLRMKIYKHQIYSLIGIGSNLIFIFGMQLYLERDNIKLYFIKITGVIGTSICRAFLDTTEKYLMEYDHIDVFKLM